MKQLVTATYSILNYSLLKFNMIPLIKSSILLLCALTSTLVTVSGQVTYPDANGVIEPIKNLLPPGADIFTPPVNSLNPASGAPQFSEWTRDANPNENIIATGQSFTTYTGNLSGKDTRFLVYGRSANSGDVLKDGKILS
jgi:hypothetical protein